MTHVLIKHPVKNFEAWKTAFDNFVDFRRTSGEKSHRVMQADGDPNNLVVFFEWESEDKARAFLSSDDLKNAMGEAGVAGPPEITFLQDAFSGTI